MKKLFLSVLLSIAVVSAADAATLAQMEIVPSSTAAITVNSSSPTVVDYTVTANAPVTSLQIISSPQAYPLPNNITATVQSDTCTGHTLAPTQTCHFALSLISSAGHVGQIFTLVPAVSANGGAVWSIPVAADRISATVSAAPSTFIVTPSGDGNETISPNTAQTVASGSTQSFTVIPDAGYGVSTTVGGTCPAGSFSGSTYTTGAITANCTVSFSAVPTYSVTPSGDGNVTISPNIPQTVASGSTQSFTVTANSGYAVSNTVGGTCPAGSFSGSTYTTGVITANCTVVFSSTQIISVIQPSLMLVPADNSGAITYSGILTVQNMSSSAVTNLSASTTSSQITVTPNDGCNATSFSLSPNQTCNFTFTMPSTDLPLDASKTITITGQQSGGFTYPPVGIAAISVTAFSPPQSPTNNASLMLVVGCSSIPEVLQLANLTTSSISGITASASSDWTSSRSPTLTNNCSGVTLHAYSSTNGTDVCSIAVTPNGSAVSGDYGTLTFSGTGTNTASMIAAVKSANAIPGGIVVGSALPGTSPSETVIYANQTCNLVKVAASVDQSAGKVWDPNGTKQSTGGTSTAGNLGQQQSILAIHTIGFLENGGAGTAPANYAVGLCTPLQLTENNALTWYLPSVGSGVSTNPATITSNGDELGLALYYGVNNGSAGNTLTYWSATEFTTDSALNERFITDEIRDASAKGASFSVRCIRALTY